METHMLTRFGAGLTAALMLGLFATPAEAAGRPSAPAPAAAAAADENTDPLPDLAPALMKSWSISPETLKPALERIAAKKTARVLYLGGSITQNPGWQNMLSAYLARRYPKTQFTCDNIGIGSLDSRSHAFRWRTHGKGADPDLIFFEAAVNDAQNIGTKNKASVNTVRKAYEGTVRALRTTYPKAGLVLLHFAQPTSVRMWQKGQMPRITQIHEAIGKHYGLPQLYLNKEVADRISAGQFSWEKDFVNLHPSPFGQRLYFNSVRRLIETADALPNGRELTLPAPQTADCWSTADYILAEKAYDLNKATHTQHWKAPGAFRRFYNDCAALVAKGNGASFSMDFEGRLMGVYTISGPTSASLEWSVDGSKWKTVNTFTPLSRAMSYPYPFVLTETLPEGKHTAKFRVKANGRRDTVVLYALMTLGARQK